MHRDQHRHAIGATSLAKEEIGKVEREREREFPTHGGDHGNATRHWELPQDHGNAQQGLGPQEACE